MRRLSSMRALAALFPVLLLCTAKPATAGPWQPQAGSGSIGVIYGHTSGDLFWLGEREFNLPGELRYNTTTLTMQVGATSWLAFDASAGYQRRTFESSRPNIISSSNDSGGTDPGIGIRLQLLDEFEHDYWPTVSTRIGYLFYNGSDASSFGSTSKGSNTLEAELAVGRYFGKDFSLSGSAGMLRRSSDLPREMTYSVGASYTPIKEIAIHLDYHWIRSNGTRDVRLSGSFAERYEQRKLEEDVLGLGASFSLGKRIGLDVGYEHVLNGRNTLRGETFSAGISFSF